MAPPRICTIGDLVTDVVVHLDSDPRRGTDTPASVRHARGGSAANVAVAAVAAGGIGRFIGQVGADSRGSGLIGELQAAGVETRIQQLGTTGTIVVLVDETGERSFLSDRGASVQLSTPPAGVLEDVDLLHIPAYSLMAGPLAETCQHLIGSAVERGTPISISTSSTAVIAEYGRARFLELISHIRPALVIANHDEARFILQGHPWFSHASATVVTAGSREARVSRPGGSDVRCSPDPKSARDTTGAGDAFTGAFLVAYANGATDSEALEAGHMLAGRTLDVSGAGLAAEAPDQS